MFCWWQPLFVMKPLYSLALLACFLVAWQFLPHPKPVEIFLGDHQTLPKQKPKPHSTPLWEHAAQSIEDQASAWKIPAIELPKIELPEIVAQKWPGRAPVKTRAKITAGAQLSQYETLLCDMANHERRKRGLKPLKISPALADVARAHALEMAQKAYFAHESPDPKLRTVIERYKLKFKVTPRLVAENIYKLEGPSFYKLSAQDFRRAHAGWMKSPGHRANILRDSPAGGPTEIGVGIVVRNGSFWATQNFARP